MRSMEGDLGQVKVIQFKRKWRWNPRRGLANLTFLMLMVIFFLIVMYFTASKSQGRSDYQQKVLVEKGDTLWAIALKYYPQVDPRKTVAEIKRINNMKVSKIYPGQVLRLPD